MHHTNLDVQNLPVFHYGWFPEDKKEKDIHYIMQYVQVFTMRENKTLINTVFLWNAVSVC